MGIFKTRKFKITYSKTKAILSYIVATYTHNTNDNNENSKNFLL